MASDGLLITLEGPEGSGKTTQAASLKAYLEELGHRVSLFAEPGGTRISGAVREILLDRAHAEMSPRAEALLFLAARAQLVEEAIRPALAERQIVICDRFTDSTLAYQGASTGLPIEELTRLNDFATAGLRPDLTLLLDIDPSRGLERQGTWNRMEARGMKFHRLVRQAYMRLAELEPGRIVRIDADRGAAEVEAAVRAAVESLVGRGRTGGGVRPREDASP